MKDFWYDKVEVSIFLCSKGSDTPSCAGGAVTDAQRDQIKTDLESLRPLVQEIYYESGRRRTSASRTSSRTRPSSTTSTRTRSRSRSG